MPTISDKHLRLRGKNKDIYFLEFRVPTLIQPLLKKKTISQSLETSDIRVARAKRDDFMVEIKQLKEKTKEGEYRYFLDKYKSMTPKELEVAEYKIEVEIYDNYPHIGHPQDSPDLPRMTETEEAEIDALLVAKGMETPEHRRLTLREANRLNKEEKEYPLKTAGAHDIAVEKFLKHLKKQNIQVATIKRKDVRNFINSRKKENQATLKKDISCLSQMWKYASDEEETDLRNPFEKHGIKVSDTKQSYLAWDIDELREVLENLNTNLEKLPVYISWYTGARLGEVMSIRPEDIYVDKKTNVQMIKIKPLRKEYKSEKDKAKKNVSATRETPVHKLLVPKLHGFNGWGSLNLKEVGRNFTDAKMPIRESRQYCFHSIRKNAITNLMNGGVPEFYTARMVGHATTGLTMSYGLYAQEMSKQIAFDSINKIPEL